MIALLALLGCGEKAAPAAPPPATVGIVVLKPESVELETVLPGRVEAFETSEVRPQVDGIITRRYFIEGAEVREGQPLYQIDDAPYRAALRQAASQLERANAAVEAIRLQAQRYGELVKSNAVSKQEADDARAASRQARAEVSAQSAALESARIDLGYTKVRAPISGRIGRSLFTVGALVQDGQADPLATIQRIDPVYVNISQPAEKLVALRTALAGGSLAGGGPAGTQVSLRLPTGALYPAEGRLQFADVTVDASTGSVNLRATFPNPDGLLLPGMFVRARILEGVAQNAIMVPAPGVERDEAGRPIALVVDPDGKVGRRSITTERLVGDRWLVSNGLSAGDRVIVQGGETVAPGATVKVRQVSSARPPAAPEATGSRTGD